MKCLGCHVCTKETVRFDRLPQGRTIVVQNEDGKYFATASSSSAWPVVLIDGSWVRQGGEALALATFEPDAKVTIIDSGNRICAG